MADVYSAIILDNDYWDGTESWAGETTEGNRDTKYGTRRFTSCGAWESDRDGNSSATDDEYGRVMGPWASDDTGEVNLEGWPAVNCAIIECPLTLPDGANLARHNGIYGDVTTAHRLVSIYDVQTSLNAASNVIFDGLQIYQTGTNPGINAHFLANDVDVKNCVIKGSSGAGRGITSDQLGTLTVTNIVITGEWDYGVWTAEGKTSVIYNCTIETDGHGIGHRDYLATTTIKNCAVFNNTDDFSSIDIIDYCASDEGEGTNEVDWDSEATDWAANFNDYSNGDFTPLNQDLPGAGIGPGTDANVPTTDIIGNPRSGATCTIGAFEYQSVGGYTLTADAGTYFKTGTAAELLTGRKLSIEAGSISLAGSDLDLFKGFLLPGEAGSYSKTGQDLSLLKDNILNIEEGSYNLTGQDAGLLFGRVITNDPGTYSISGQDVIIVKGRVISIDPGAYSLIGQDVSILKDSKILIDSGAYSLIGQDVTITKGRRLAIESGTYSIAGQDVNLLKAYILSADGGVYDLTGSDVTLIYTPTGAYVLVAESGSYNLTGQDITLLCDFLLSANVGSYTLTGQDASVLRGYPLTADAGAYNITGQNVNFLRDLVITMEAGGYTVVGNDAALIYSTGVRISSVTFDFKKRTINFTLAKRSIDFTLSQRNITMELE